MKLRLIYLLLPLVLSGCGKQIDEFVNSGAKHPVLPVIEPPTFTTASSKTIKYSPGAALANSSQVSAKYNLTPTNFVATSPQVDVRVSINQNRVQ